MRKAADKTKGNPGGSPISIRRGCSSEILGRNRSILKKNFFNIGNHVGDFTPEVMCVSFFGFL